MISLRARKLLVAHSPLSKLRRAAWIAAWASSRVPLGTLAMTSPVDGLMLGKVSPPDASLHSPSM
jgi:hypothetical protein